EWTGSTPGSLRVLTSQRWSPPHTAACVCELALPTWELTVTGRGCAEHGEPGGAVCLCSRQVWPQPSALWLRPLSLLLDAPRLGGRSKMLPRRCLPRRFVVAPPRAPHTMLAEFG